MKFSESWLRTWVNPSVDVDVLADQLSMVGLEVDGVEAAAAAFSGVLVGRVETLEQHPDADKLRVCQVNVGAQDLVQIICGAANVAAGTCVPVAMVGARLPGDFKIKKAKLRGVLSFGMICSATELGMAETSDGILMLPHDAPIGTDIREYLSLDDTCIDVDLTPDRGDCLSVSGIAREVGVINRCAVTPPKMMPVEAQCDDKVSVELSAGKACPRYLCRVVKGVDVGALSPLWLTERLRRSGVRSISVVVDITNYVLLELGQPMHAFDLAKISDGVVVRLARTDESLTLLDGQTVKLNDETLVIADGRGPLAMAGIMGGEPSAVSGKTRDILFESAFFAPIAIAGKARSYGLHTDSSHRFERGVDWQLQRQAMERATALLLDIAGGTPGPIVEVVSDADLPRLSEVTLRKGQVERILGVHIDDDIITDILCRLGMDVRHDETGWHVVAPSARFDVEIEVDLIEEVGRIFGYSEIPPTHAHAASHPKAHPETNYDLNKMRDEMVARGYHEAITYSFISVERQQQFDPGVSAMALANPISADMAVMRTSLWPGLMQALLYNRARQQARIRLFETGQRFLPQGDDIQQENMISGVICGTRYTEQWGVRAEKIDFFDLKSDVELLLSLTADMSAFRFVAESHPALHPGQCARIYRDQRAVGWIGMLHPALENALSTEGAVGLFELRLGELIEGHLPQFQSVSKFPAIRRDIAPVVRQSVTFSELKAAIERVSPEILRDILPFDVYTGEKIDSGLKSVALGLILQDSSKTLTDEAVELIMSDVLTVLEKEFDAQLRS